MEGLLNAFMNIEILKQVAPLLLEGLWMTLKLAAVALPVSLALGVLIAVAQDVQNRFVRGVIIAYVDVMRAFPPLVLLIFIFYGLPMLGVQLGEFSAAVLALVLNGSSYFSEILRAGMGAVPQGQREAARSTGMSWAQTTSSVVLPQGVRNVLPDLVSNTIELAKQTSIASVVALQELLRSAQIAQGLTYNATPLVVAALAYFLLFWPFVRLVSRLQNNSIATLR